MSDKLEIPTGIEESQEYLQKRANLRTSLDNLVSRFYPPSEDLTESTWDQTQKLELAGFVNEFVMFTYPTNKDAFIFNDRNGNQKSRLVKSLRGEYEPSVLNQAASIMQKIHDSNKKGYEDVDESWFEDTPEFTYEGLNRFTSCKEVFNHVLRNSLTTLSRIKLMAEIGRL